MAKEKMRCENKSIIKPRPAELIVETTVKLPKGFSLVHYDLVHNHYFKVVHKELRFGDMVDTWVAGFNTETKVARPCHGYFAPHKTGKRLKKFFESIGYEWDNS